jgi:hypothetical protein
MEGEYCCASSRIVLMRIEPHGVLPLGASKGSPRRRPVVMLTWQLLRLQSVTPRSKSGLQRLVSRS